MLEFFNFTLPSHANPTNASASVMHAIATHARSAQYFAFGAARNYADSQGLFVRCEANRSLSSGTDNRTFWSLTTIAFRFPSGLQFFPSCLRTIKGCCLYFLVLLQCSFTQLTCTSDFSLLQCSIFSKLYRRQEGSPSAVFPERLQTLGPDGVPLVVLKMFAFKLALKHYLSIPYF